MNTAKALHVMLVIGDSALREHCAAQLSLEPTLHLTSLENSDEALRELAAMSYDMVIIEGGGRTGIPGDFIRKIRTDYPALGIILILDGSEDMKTMLPELEELRVNLATRAELLEFPARFPHVIANIKLRKKERIECEERIRTIYERMKSIFDTLGERHVESIAIIDSSYRVHFHNRRAAEGKEASRDMPCFRLYYERSTPCEFCLLKKVLESDSLMSTEISTEEGREYFLMMMPFVDSDGERKVLRIMRDITEWRTLNRQMQRQVDEFFSIFNCLDLGIYIVDPETYTILAANTQAIKLLGENPVDKKCFEVLLKGHSAPCSHCDNALISRGIIQSGTLPWEFKSAAHDRWYRCISKIISWPGKKFAKMEVIMDITESMRTEREINTLRVFKDKIRALPHLALMEFDRKGKIIYANEASAAMLGNCSEELMGLFIWQLPDDSCKEAIYRTIERPGATDREALECTLNGKEKKVEVHLNFILHRDVKGSLIDGSVFIIEKPRKITRFY
ncbi:MAG: PAS domain-containing protein [Candidatus Eremiobacteraeota bacterium]|nr:PAS domain-containing protein [Candidatus Eremiobacteraeota bacterium]